MSKDSWMGAPGASEEEIAALERRLGVSLPPSYRQFLAVSDGWREFWEDEEPGLLLPAAKVGWTRDLDPHLASLSEEWEEIPD
ncbi:SMI1/KNR4 family protein [Bailinhaonella thermotolerans]|uniref:SMI1/KNR4 family protein n=2 Tax=Bailinhaonella thermotolerans TaxID=1070861 RepID=A0A3A4AZ54_9ACTN|nr:SMI1/KNR4 family protein [Bailinhaonella thermotolerans]